MKRRATIHPCALTIAGSDSGGNAGVQADLRTFHAYGIHGCTVFAALTAQNPRGVRAVHVVPPAFVANQLDAVFEMYGVKALKTGMLATADVIATVAEKLAERPRVKKVIDPVMVATSGAKLRIGDTKRRRHARRREGAGAEVPVRRAGEGRAREVGRRRGRTVRGAATARVPRALDRESGLHTRDRMHDGRRHRGRAGSGEGHRGRGGGR